MRNNIVFQQMNPTKELPYQTMNLSANILHLRPLGTRWSWLTAVLLTRSMRFKEISIANLSAAVVSALLTIVLVSAGYTYWAIAWQQVSLTTVRVAMLWLLSRWQPTARPDFDIIRKIFYYEIGRASCRERV